jgi:hypothetical protein
VPGRLLHGCVRHRDAHGAGDDHGLHHEDRRPASVHCRSQVPGRVRIHRRRGGGADHRCGTGGSSLLFALTFAVALALRLALGFALRVAFAIRFAVLIPGLIAIGSRF